MLEAAARTDLGLQHVLVLVQVLARRQRPQEARQALDVSRVLQHLAHARHLLLREPQHERLAPASAAVLVRVAGGGRGALDGGAALGRGHRRLDDGGGRWRHGGALTLQGPVVHQQLSTVRRV